MLVETKNISTSTLLPDNKKVIQQALQDPITSLRYFCDNSLYRFIQTFWEEVSNDIYKPNWHIEYLCHELEQIAYQVAENQPKLHDLIINIPPGTTKTITCSIMFPVWCWTKWHHLRFITASYSAALSLESAEYSRDLIRSEKFRSLYPELDIKDDKDTKGNYKVVKKYTVYPGQAPRLLHGGNRYSTSVGGTLMGFHGHILIVDDPINPTQATSEVELANVNRWMEQTLPTRKTDKAVSTTILVMQRLHQDDPSGRWINNKKLKTKHISLPGEIRSYQERVFPQELIKFYKNDLLDPVRLSWNELNELEARLGQYGYAGQVGQNPTPPGGGMFKVDNISIIDHLPVEVNHIQTVRYWDKAGSEGVGCFTTGVKMSYWKNGKFIVHDVKRGQWGTDNREKILKSTAQADQQYVFIGVEQEPGSGGKESAEATIRNLAGFHVTADRPTGDKSFRADPFSVQVNNGNVLLLRGEWNRDYIEELRYFPFGTYKDQVDASSGAFNMLTKRRIARMI